MGTQTGGAPKTSSDELVGRRRELEALRGWLDAARDGSGRLVLCAGEPGIGKTRLAQELAGAALAGGTAVAWGRCVEAEGAPAFWPWRQVIRAVGVDPDVVLAGDIESPDDRFRVFEDIAQIVRNAAQSQGLVVILDDIHWSDEPSLLVLRHLADHLAGAHVLVLASFRETAPSTHRSVLADVLRSPGAERLDLRGFNVAEVSEQLSRLIPGGTASTPDPARVLDVTDGNPLFVREVARAVADGTWHPTRPPRTVLDVVRARLDRVSAECRRFVQAAAIVGRDFTVALTAAAVDEPVSWCLPAVDEAIAHGLVDRIADTGDYRFVHALTRDAVEASLTTADRTALHRAVAEALEEQHGSGPSERLTDIARHWAELAPYGAAATARTWAIRAADDAVRRLAYEEGVRLYQAALTYDSPGISDAERCEIQIALGRAAYFAGNLDECVAAASAAAETARSAADPELAAQAALVLEAVPDPAINAVAKQLCEEALAGLADDAGHAAVRARLLAQRSHLAFYDGEQGRVAALSASAVDLARASGDDRALIDALHARKEACPGPLGRAERVNIATDMLTLAQRSGSARTAMWGEIWRIETLLEGGQLAAALDELSALQVAVARVGGPVSGWHLDRVTACLAQAQGRFAEAAAAGRRAFDRMRPIEPRPAAGAYFALQCALANHVGVTDETADFALRPFDSPPRFRTMARISRAFLLVQAGLVDDAAASYHDAGPIEAWSLPAFFVVPGYVYGALAAAALGRHEDLAALLERLEPFRGEHVVGEGVAYMGPVELTLGRGAAALGDLDGAIDSLTAAADTARRVGAPGFAAEANYYLATALQARRHPGDGDRAAAAANAADRSARALGMAAYTVRTAALVDRLRGERPPALSPREDEVAGLVAEGLTNRQIAARLIISERTAQNHVQHILTKLGFTTRSQIAAWRARPDR